MVTPPLKRLITGVLFLFLSTTVFAADYYWVGGTGSWTDLTHWATASGGTVKHSTLPGATDNVFFDANSFTGADQVVTITYGATCRDMNWTGVTNNPEIYSFFDDINIYGSLILPAAVKRNFLGNVRLKATSGSHVINLANLPLSTPNNETIYMEGAGGTWTLAAALTINGVSLTAGTFNTNGFALNCSIFGTTGTSTRAVNLGSSQINCPTWNVANATGLTLNAGTSTITSSFRLVGGGLTYNNLIVDGTTEIRDNNTFNNITLNAGSVLKLTPQSTQTFSTLVSNGTAANYVTIQSTVAGSPARLTKNDGGAVTISYAKIKDNQGTGGTFTANNSENLGNVAGWTIPVVEPTVSASNLTFSAVSSNSVKLSWTSGNGAGRIILARPALAVGGTLSDGSTFTASSVFGGGSAFWFADQYVVYNGSGNTVTVTGLLPGTTYHFAIYEYNSIFAPNYLATSTVGNQTTTTATLGTQPTTSVSNIAFTNKTANSMTVSWTNGNGARRVVIARPGTLAAATNLNDGNDYAASSTFGNGTMIAGTSYVVYNGTGNSFTVSGLSAETTYSFAIVEYNGTGTTANYFTPGATGSAATIKAKPSTPSSGITIVSRTATDIQIAWTKGDGERRLVVVKQGSAVNVVPADGAYYTANGNFSTATDLGGGNKVVYSGTGSEAWITNLTPSTTYYIAIFEYNGSAANATSYLTTAATASGTTIVAEPTVASKNFLSSSETFTSFTIQWTKGDGARRLLALKDAVTGGNAYPVDGVTYQANATYGQGTALATDFYVVYEGTGNSVTVTGLQPGKAYRIYTWEFNGTGTSTNYLTSSITLGSANTLKYKPTVQASELAVTATTSNSATLTWKRGDGTHSMLVAKAGSPVNAQFKDSTTLTNYGGNAGTVYGQGTDLGNGNIVVYFGSNATATITNLTPGTTYHFAVYEFNQSYIASKYINYFLTSAPSTASTTTLAGGANYYWVGGSGNWTDYANHWATSSGGSAFHSKAPGSADNVYFDANSFSADDQKVTIDVDNIACKNMDWSAITKKVSFAGATCFATLSVYGSIKLSGNLTPSLSSIWFKATTPGNVIDMGGKSAFTTSCGSSVYIDGYQGEWTLNGNLSGSSLYLYHGTLRAENSNLSFSGISSFYTEASKALYLGNSTFHTSSWNDLDNLTVTGGTLIFDYNNNFLFDVNGASFEKVVLKGSSSGYSGTILGGGTINNLELASGTKAYFESGKTFNLGTLTVAGDTSRTTIIGATVPGTAATFYKATGTINIDFVQLKDNKATGGAQFIATNSVDGGNVTGWNITNPPIYQPKISASDIEFQRVFARDLKIKWISGDGMARIVVAKENAPVDRYPENGKTYAGNNIYGTGSDIGNGNFVVYNGVSDTLTVKGLTPGKRYHFSVYEYNAWNNQVKYRGRPAPVANVVTMGAADIIISNTPATVCNVKYFDDGGNGVYTKEEPFTQTFTPSTPGSKLGVLFSSFETLSFDTLYIYDGSSKTAPLLGKFASTKRPTDAIIAKNGTGALTFWFNARTISSADAAGWQAELFCTGTPTTEPTAQASALTVSEPTGNSLRIRLSKGNGGGRVVIARADNAVSKTPVDGTDFTANTTFGDGTLLGDGNYVVYSGEGDDVTITGLRSNGTYHFAAFEYNGSGGTTNYLTANPATGNGTTLFVTPTEASYNLTFSNISSFGMYLYFTGGNGSNKLVVARKGAPVNFIPVDGTVYSANQDLGNDTKVISNESGSFANASGLTQATEYHFAIFDFNGTGTQTKYLTTSFLTGKQSTKGPLFYMGEVSDTYCPNSAISVSWDAWNGSFASDNKFSLQLSDETGNFANPSVLKDTITNFYQGTINARIPNTVKGGSGYKLRIVTSNPVSISENVRTIAIPVVSDVTFTVEDSTFVSSSAINNQWMRNGVPIAGATQQSFKYEDGGRYTVRVTENGCYKEAPLFVITANEETVFGKTVRVYPNPAKTTLEVESPEGGDGNYVIRDIHGKAVAAGSLTRSKAQVDVSALTPGMYLISVSRGGRSVTKVFIKE